MDFGKNILEKYGWKEGDGLGKDSNGITKALRPSFKFDKQGLGADPAEEFNNNWWERTFNEASKNINIQKDGEKVSFTVDGSTEITTKSYSVKKLKDNMEGKKYKNFLKSSILSKSNEVAEKDTVDMDSLKLPKIPVLNDNDLVAACGGRTAHKGARHGLTLSGKLARIKEQDDKMMALIRKAANESSDSDENKEKSQNEGIILNFNVSSKVSKSQRRKERRVYSQLSQRIDSLGLEVKNQLEQRIDSLGLEVKNHLSQRIDSLGLEVKIGKFDSTSAEFLKVQKRKHLDEVQEDEEKPEKDKIENLLTTTDYQIGKSKYKRKKTNKVYNQLSRIIIDWNIESESSAKPATIVEETKSEEPFKRKKGKKHKKNKNKNNFEANRYKSLINELTDSDLEANSSRKDPVHKLKKTESMNSAKALKKKNKQKKKLKGIVLEDCDVVIT